MNLYETKEIGDGLIGIGERCSAFMMNAMYVVIGARKAALIDTGMGIGGDLDAMVSRFTKLPVVVLSTHADPDHIGANSLFDDIHLSKRDDDLIPWALSLKTRLSDLPVMAAGNAALCDYAKEHIVGESRFEYTDIADGERFDLGGRILEAIALPGHTPGSMCFINREENYVLTGDSINPSPWLWLERCTTIEEYVASLRRFRTVAGEGRNMYCGHGHDPLPTSIVEDLVEACDELLRGDVAKDTPFKVPYAIDTSRLKVMQHDHGVARVIYNEYRIR